MEILFVLTRSERGRPHTSRDKRAFRSLAELESYVESQMGTNLVERIDPFITSMIKTDDVTWIVEPIRFWEGE